MIGQKIKTIRLLKNKTQKELANEIGITQAFLSLIEKGEREVSINLLKALGKALNVPLTVLMYLAMEDNDFTPEAKHMKETLGKEFEKLLIDAFA